MSNNIKVVCRFRPQNSLEIKEGGQPIINYDDNGQTVKVDVSLHLNSKPQGIQGVIFEAYRIEEQKKIRMHRG